MAKVVNYVKLYNTYLYEKHDENLNSNAVMYNCFNKQCQNPIKHLSVDSQSSIFQCWVCGIKGNAKTMLTLLHSQALAETTDAQYEYLSRMRGIPASSFKNAGYAYQAEYDRWLVPYYIYDPEIDNFRDTLSNLGYFLPGLSDPKEQFVIRKAPAMQVYLYNPGLHAFNPISNRAIIAEGESDTLCYYSANPETLHLVLGKPGTAFNGSHLASLGPNISQIDWMLDNDLSGKRQTAKAISICRSLRPKIKHRVLYWEAHPLYNKISPWSGKEIKDLRDMYIVNPEEIREDVLEQYLLPYDEVADSFEKDDTVVHSPEIGAGRSVAIRTPFNAKVTQDEMSQSEDDQEVELSAGYVRDASVFPKITSFQTYMDKVKSLNYLYGKTTIQAIAACLGVTTSINIPGEPLWIFLRGQASSGKSTHIESYGGTHQYFDNLSRLSAESLVSGWVDDSPGEASYLARLFNKTLFVKDFTPNLTGSDEDKVKLFGLLTDIYDGQLKIHFGNKKTEEYHKINFNMIAGVTDIIDSHSAASIGERFLRVDWMGDEFNSRDYLKAAMRNFGKRDERKKQYTEYTLGFYNYLRDQPINLEVDPMFEDPICDLATFVATLRTKVERNKSEGILYRPRPEIETRIGMQLLKLHTATAIVLNSQEQAFEITRKVALDTCYGYPLDIVRYILNNPRATRDEIAEGADVNPTRAYNILSDLCTTGVLRADTASTNLLEPNKKGRPSIKYVLNSKLLPALKPEQHLERGHYENVAIREGRGAASPDSVRTGTPGFNGGRLRLPNQPS